MPVLNPFVNNSLISMASLTEAINLIPNDYGWCEQNNIFPDRGVTTRDIFVEEMNGVLNLLPTQPLGSPGTLGKQGKRKGRSFRVPHIPHDDAVLPEEVQGVRAFGSEDQMQAFSFKVNDKLAAMKMKHMITREHLRMGALKGLILDADGSTLYDLYSEFQITQKVINFALTTGSTKVRQKCLEVSRHVEDNLFGETFSRIRVLCSPSFFDALIGHAEVEKAFQNWQAAAERLGGDPRQMFEFGGLQFTEYRGSASDPDGNVRKFIADDEAHAFPMNTQQTFVTYNAPADFNETVNTIGIPFYSKQEPRKFGRGMDLHTQSNPLPLCQRPALLVKLTKA